AGHADHLRARRPRELLDRGFERGLVPRADRDPDALLRETERDRLADALAAAGDQRRLSLQAEVHVRLLRRAGLTLASLSNIYIPARPGDRTPADERSCHGEVSRGERPSEEPRVLAGRRTEGGRVVWLAGQATT